MNCWQANYASAKVDTRGAPEDANFDDCIPENQNCEDDDSEDDTDGDDVAEGFDNTAAGATSSSNAPSKRSRRTKKKWYQCEDCGFIKKTRKALLNHRQMHTSPMVCYCYVCGQKFMVPFHLKRHVRTAHKGMPTFKCGQCGAGFKLKSGLKKHRRSNEICNNWYKERPQFSMDQLNCPSHLQTK
ncbi:zinc finger protein 225-like [Sabethes cyaneus]|uniref:zinc finger protein 225-like n=1 Tax=Sabethes cyaneus TaxID=53552 RepID=UPI00237D72B0|nr:zinc finger protein 225-like [Sabethes cyaneus]